MVNNFKQIDKPVLRFAPSPTGLLHVGGARTAIFNWLIAKKYQGQFLLRIEDTDNVRSSDKTVEQIVSALKWLGLDWNDDLYFQSAHRNRHIQVAKQLLQNGKAYRCFCSREELQQKRLFAEKNKINQRYDGTCRNLSQQQIEKNLEQNKPFSIRFKVEPGEIVYNDLIHGDTKVNNNTLDDFIILRDDGSPTYQLAVVTDDHDMKVSIVLRGDDHIANTNKQILLYQALDWNVPLFGHIPLILGPDKIRLSKRHGAAGVEEFKNLGIVPEALFNYLCLLGWNPGDDKEIMNISEIINAFDIERINPSAAVFDEKKLYWINSKYIAELDPDYVWQEVDDWLQAKGLKLDPSETNQFKLLIDLQQSRSKSMIELKDSLVVYFYHPEDYEEKGVKKYFKKEGTSSNLKQLVNQLESNNRTLFSNIDALEKFIRTFAEELSVSAAKVIHPLRLALTGSTTSPGIFELMFILGQEKTIERLDNAIKFIELN